MLPSDVKQQSANTARILRGLSALEDTLSTETTSAAILAALPSALDGDRLKVAIPSSSIGLTDTELRASAVPVSLSSTTITGSVAVTGTFYQATQPVSAAALPLPTGAATETTLSAANAKLPALGAAATSAAIPVSIATDQAGLVDQYITGEGSQKADGQNVLLAVAGTGGLDAMSYRSIAFQIVPAAGTITTGVITFEASNDNTNWRAVGMYDPWQPQNTPVTNYTLAASTNRMFAGTLPMRYFRARISTVIAGTTTGVQAFTTLRTEPYVPSYQYVIGAAGNLAVNVAQMNGVATTMGNGVAGTGVQRVALASDNTANSNPWLATLSASAAQGSSTTHHAISAASTNATSVKASAGTIGCLQVSNINAAFRYLKLYNKASAPTVGTDTPVMTIALPPDSNQFINCGPYGIRFSTGIAYALTTGMAVADTGAVSATEHSVGIFYT